MSPIARAVCNWEAASSRIFRLCFGEFARSAAGSSGHTRPPLHDSARLSGGSTKVFMDVHLIDGTYELFRHFFALPPHADEHGNEVGAVCGVLNSVLALLREGATHIGVATDHVIESFRNELYSGYKTAEGVPEKLLAQFPIVEEALQNMGVAIWPMVQYEADDALASAATLAARDARVRQV